MRDFLEARIYKVAKIIRPIVKKVSSEHIAISFKNTSKRLKPTHGRKNEKKNDNIISSIQGDPKQPTTVNIFQK